MRKFLLVPALVALAACAQDDAVIFATATSIAVDADATKSSATIGYDRFEGVSAPVFEDGEIPPVYARIGANLNIVNPEIQQEYATGRAALNATGAKSAESEECGDLSGAGKARCLAAGRDAGDPFYFTTATTLGLKFGFSGGQPSSATLGYKRIEASVIPARADNAEAAVGDYNRHDYMSVYARLAFSNKFVSEQQTGEQSEVAKEMGVTGWPKNEAFYGQVIATGSAAEKLALKRKDEITNDAAESIVATRVVSCDRFKVGEEDDDGKAIMDWLKKASGNKAVEDERRRTMKDYARRHWEPDASAGELVTCKNLADLRKSFVATYVN
jgi:hypothetical protein